MDIFRGMFHSFLGTAISSNRSRRTLVEDFYLYSDPNNYYFGRASQRLQSKYNWTNTATILKTAEKSHESLENRSI